MFRIRILAENVADKIEALRNFRGAELQLRRAGEKVL